MRRRVRLAQDDGLASDEATVSLVLRDGRWAMSDRLGANLDGMLAEYAVAWIGLPVRRSPSRALFLLW
jgi:hypothetical protein